MEAMKITGERAVRVTCQFRHPGSLSLEIRQRWMRGSALPMRRQRSRASIMSGILTCNVLQ